jgi:hypothetical protein
MTLPEEPHNTATVRPTSPTLTERSPQLFKEYDHVERVSTNSVIVIKAGDFDERLNLHLSRNIDSPTDLNRHVLLPLLVPGRYYLALHLGQLMHCCNSVS